MTTMNMQAPLPQGGLPQKTDADYPTRMGEIKPGSTIRVGGPKVGGAPFEAIVLQTMQEWGATGEPALFVAHAVTHEEFAISQAAGYEVTVTADASQFLSEGAPEGSIRVQVRPQHGTAMQFTGGIENAMAIVTWCLGRGAPFYSKGSDTEDETITFGGIGNTGGVARVGDWIVLYDDTDTFVIVSDLAAAHEQEI